MTIRLAVNEIAHIEKKASASLMSRSAYVRMRLLSNETPTSPAIAALAHVIAIREMIADDPTQVRHLLPSFDSAIHALCAAAYAEIDQL